MATKHEYPGGRPVREPRVVGRSIWRVPDDGYVTPRLRKDSNIQAIGFVHQFDREQDDE